MNKSNSVIDLQKYLPPETTPVLLQLLSSYWHKFCAALTTATTTDWQLLEPIASSLCKVWISSEFAAEFCIHHPQEFLTILQQQQLQFPLNKAELQQHLAETLQDAVDEHQLSITLRQFKRRILFRIIWCDITALADLSQTMQALSALADCILGAALNFLYQSHTRRFGEPRDSNGNPQQLLIVAVGKLGGYELNLSSDIDLIFIYPEANEIDCQGRKISCELFFTRLSQALIKMLDENTEHGYVFRVDMRLRPYGNSGGQLVMSLNACEIYYQQQGRDWERYALLKARILSGQPQHRAQLQKTLLSFVYRRYLDYNVIQSLRELKALINREIVSRQLVTNIKLGAGGIREIEFIVQAFQLIHGGKDTTLQQQHLLTALANLQKQHCLQASIVQQLRDSYIFLRNLENRLQAYRDQQTQALPTEFLIQLRLAYAMGYTSWDHLQQNIAHHMNSVHQHFTQMVTPAEEKIVQAGSLTAFHNLWSENFDPHTATHLLQQHGFHNASAALEWLQTLRVNPQYRAMSGRGQSRLQRLIPLLLNTVAHYHNNNQTLKRMLPLIEKIMPRSAYLALLIENPNVLQLLSTLCSSSTWITTLVTENPLLLDELLDASLPFAPTDTPNLREDLTSHFEKQKPEDFEQEMNILRHHQKTHLLRIAVANIMHHLQTAQTSQVLATIADALLQQAYVSAWRYLTARHGYPAGCNDDHANFAIIAYGKLGSLEINFNSDLDLIFLFDCQDIQQKTNGIKAITAYQFYIRLAQRIIHIISTRTDHGLLYEIDTRLRPSGTAGTLVSSINTYTQYQLQNAWTWEHQALVKARYVCGDTSMRHKFDSARHSILKQKRDTSKLRHAIVDMREQMSKSHNDLRPIKFDLKNDRGGMADIEFLVQYLVLNYAEQYEALLLYTDNSSILRQCMNLQLLTTPDGSFLLSAYDYYLEQLQQLSLNNQLQLNADDIKPLYHGVIEIWHKYL